MGIERPRLFWKRRLLAVAASVVLVSGLSGCAGQGLFQDEGITIPAPDGSACYDQRKNFYEAGKSAVSNENNRQLLDNANTLAQIYQSPAFGFVKGMVGIPSLPPGVDTSLLSALNNLSERANQDGMLIRRVSATYGALVQCRRGEVASIRRDMRGRRITQAVASEKANGIRQLALADAEAARVVNRKLIDRSRQVDVAVGDVDTKLGSVPAGARRTQISQVHNTVQSNQRALTTQAAAVESSVQDTSFNMSGA